jgi:hypothetical protein
VTPLRKQVIRAVVLAIMVLALTGNVAAAGEGGDQPQVVPYDPGLLGHEAPPPAPWPSAFAD